MSMLDSMDDALLGADDDEELDYDLEKDEEDALLADPDNYDDNYEEVADDAYADQTLNEEESEVLEIDANIDGLDETEEDLGDQNDTKDPVELKQEIESDQEPEEHQKDRGRFTSERAHVIHRTLKNEIPDSLDQVNVQQFNKAQRNGYKYQRPNNNRFKNRPNNNRGSVFGRVGILPAPGPLLPGLHEDKNLGKTVLINPHFRGNVQANENARLVWDAAQGQQQRYPNPQMAQVAPFQSQFPQQNQQQPSPWIHPPYHNESGNSYNAPPPGAHESHYNNQSHLNQSQGNFNNRDGRFNIEMPPPLMSHPPPHFNQHAQPPPPLLPNRPPTFHDNSFRRQYTPQNHPPTTNHFDPNLQQNYPQNFNQQPPSYAQTRQYDSGNEQFANPNYNNQYGGAIPFQNPLPQQNFRQPSNLIQTQSQFDNFNHRTNQGQFQPQVQNQFNSSRAFNNNHPINNRLNQQQRINRPPSNYNQRTPPRRRPFENNQVEPRDLPKKKKRSLELSNLHEVPTVDMPDTTTMEDKPESEDEETKAYRLKIEDQKILREKILREKEERRKQAAESKFTVSDSLITSLKTKPVVVQQQFKIQPIQTAGQAITTRVNTQTQQKNLHNQIRSIHNKRFNQTVSTTNNQPKKTQKPALMQLNQVRTVEKQPQPTRVIHNQATSTRVIQQQQVRTQPQARLMQQKQTNIIITQKITPEAQSQRIVMFKQQQPAAQQQLQPVQQQSNRRVVLKSNGATIDGTLLPETPVVVLSNLAAATTEPKIRKLCQGLGPIQNIEMIPNSRQATIRFKNVQSAHKFFKKYQRKIIDLSMIQVVLGQPIT